MIGKNINSNTEHTADKSLPQTHILLSIARYQNQTISVRFPEYYKDIQLL